MCAPGAVEELRLRQHAKLLHQTQIVSHRPVFHDLGILQTEDVHKFDGDALSLGCGEASEALTLPGGLSNTVNHDVIVFGNETLR